MKGQWMFNLMQAPDMNRAAVAAFKDGDWIPTILGVLTTTGEDRKILVVKTAQKKLKRGEKASWMPPQRQMQPGESIEDAALRLFREEVGITTEKGLLFVRSLGYFNRQLANGRAKPAGYPESRGRMMICAHLQIPQAIKGVRPCDDSIAACRFVDKDTFFELIQTASHGKRVIAVKAVEGANAFDIVRPPPAARVPAGVIATA